MVSKGFPNVTTSGRQYNFGEKPSVILYTYINLHAGTPCCTVRSRQMRDSCDPGGVADGARLAVYQTLSMEYCCSIFFGHDLVIKEKSGRT